MVHQRRRKKPRSTAGSTGLMPSGVYRRSFRTDNGPGFAGRTMHDHAARHGVELRVNQPGSTRGVACTPVQGGSSRRA